jgi:hypothetical protein
MAPFAAFYLFLADLRVLKSYHSIVVPIVDAMTALRRFALCSDADIAPYVTVVAIGVPPGCFLFRWGRALSGPFVSYRG